MEVAGRLSQQKKIGTKMLERPAMLYQQNEANSLASNHSGRDKHIFFLSYWLELSTMVPDH